MRFVSTDLDGSIGGLVVIPATFLAPFIGSFLGTLILRLPAGRPAVFDRSRCESCETALTWRDLVPLFSWLISRGRCRHCGARVSAFYPLIELAALAVALWAVLALPGNLAWAGAGLGRALLALAVIDARHVLLPDPDPAAASTMKLLKQKEMIA